MHLPHPGAGRVRSAIHVAVTLTALIAAFVGLPTRALALTLPASCTVFTDDPVAARSTAMKAAHVTELRTCIADLRTQLGLPTVTWTDATIVAGTTQVKAVHITELRTALADVFTAAGATAPTYSSIPTVGVAVFASHINELRSAIATLDPTTTCGASPTGLTPNAAAWAPSGGDGTTTVGYPAGCAYTAIANVPWLTVLSATTPTITYEVAPNDTLVSRTGTLTIVGLTFTVTQDPATEVVTYVDADAVGSVRMLTDAAGQVVARFDYLPFGTLWPGPASTQERLFAGKERDSETSYDYFGARYFTAVNGRFETADPLLDVQKALLDPQRWNRYSYVRNSPFRFVDPDGRAIDVLLDAIFIANDVRAIAQEGLTPGNAIALAGDSVGAAIPFATGIGGAARAGYELAMSGRFLEQAAQWATRLGKNADRILEGIAHGAEFRVPDLLSDEFIGEVKNSRYLYSSSQLRDLIQFATNSGRDLGVFVNGETKFAEPLLRRLRDANARIFRLVDGKWKDVSKQLYDSLLF